ncbi:MAG: hypothetical protein ACD_37C00665G0004 [uncultured bacterium]|nr:MAG: hypothetical protein ACD_37C00665G0004 [uncultured bacterium]KKQ96502.1 MAG: 50S ribosomal protein L29P [Candidatus Levybacteria bacterium GW2011_GWA1_39_11]KKR24978.1 MAG: 50S ribosomal protein L29P [Candidatus Levybacteria bacterium GW2011_GWB1_39_7]KKR27536.1 MAG: 50S ribosomal protein L29P [Microgenomates group bacterium GW2011_GWC1_39_7]KKR49828.1 MAG: 50S ribosomal protein L29P [Candidatus Levybacteria bacterium GW2011_GWA2_40_16]OGH14138.1 MAG: 50S ribosomal protein L29 [Candida
MKKKDLLEIKTKTKDELRRMIIDIKSEIGKLNIEQSLKKLKNTNAIKSKKRDIAALLTVLSMKEFLEKQDSVNLNNK